MKRRLSLLVLPALLFATALAPAPAQAADQHVFDPVLSLEGSCVGKDGVKDPSCPYPEPTAGGPRPIEDPCGTATDRHGDIYVATPKINNEGKGPEGRIDIFDPQGRFLTEIPDGHGPCGLAVDSEGNLFARQSDNGSVFAFEPDSYPPENGAKYAETVLYSPSEPPPGVESCLEAESVAVDPADDRLYIGHRCRIEERGTAGEGWPLLDPEVIHYEPGKSSFRGLDVYGANHDIYVSSYAFADGVPPRVLVFDGTDGHMKCEVDGSETPAGAFSFTPGPLIPGIAVDQANGDFYVWDTDNKAIEQFGVQGEQCKYIGDLPATKPTLAAGLTGTDIAVDDPIETGEAGYDSPNEGYVYLTSGTSSKGNLFSFKPRIAGPPEVRAQAAAAIAETEAVLEAELNPKGLDTAYRFQYTTEAAYGEHGYEGATDVPVPDADAGEGGAFAAVSEPISGLSPGTAYRFRLVASNCEAEEAEPESCLTLGEGKPGEAGEDASFATYATPPIQSCPNEALRTGFSATLPDCRAYELVTPPDTGGHIPTMALPGGLNFGNNAFDTWLASPEPGRDSLLFGSDSGAIPGIGGGGDNDTYEVQRDPVEGWRTSFIGLDGARAERASPGGVSADHRFAFWFVPSGGRGILARPGKDAQYLRVPAGSPAPSPNCAPAAEPEGRFEWVGCGSLGIEPLARGKWISPGGGHVIFATEGGAGPAERLEECAPPSGTGAIYDRTPAGPTRCVSLLPGDSTPSSPAAFQGASADGSAVAFTVAGTLYARLENAETVEVAAGNAAFGGISADGRRVFFLRHNPTEPLLSGTGIDQGDVFACDVEQGPCAGPEAAQEPIAIGSGEESVLVNVSADGSHAYFVSKAALSGEEESEWGVKAKAGEENLYAWDGEAVRFIARLSALDLTGEFSDAATGIVGGLGLWTSYALAPDPTPTSGPASDPSRTSPDGAALVFESHSNLTAYDSGGHSEVYRYDAAAPAGQRLLCISCNPTGAAAASDAQLQSDPSGVVPFISFPPVSAITHIANVSGDGRRVFFQSADRLVSADTDGKVDVYEWEASGEGGCERERGCLALISGGRGHEDDYLYSVTPDGHDVFFLSADTLLARDPDGTPSIYDARVGGGIPEPPAPSGECLGESCQPALTAPGDPPPAFEAPGAKPGKHHRRRHRHRKHHRKHHHRRGHHRRGARR